MQEHTYVEHTTTPKIKPVLIGLLGIGCILFLFLFFYLSNLNKPPHSFPINFTVEIEGGTAGGQALKILKENNVIRSEIYARLKLREIEQGRTIKAGTYEFSEPITTTEVLESLLNGSNVTNALVLTLPEGFHAREINDYIPDGIETEFDATLFDSYEGYLFPDTYFITEDMSQEDLLTLLRETRNEKISQYSQQIANNTLAEEEVVILASILEREANTEESMRLVSGILQNRLEIGMALQVDATFDYLLGKESSELTEEDLQIDSPYNTYTNRGLPPTPISNPGLLAIDAVLNPIKTDYLYYLTGNDGEFYYATTFEEHKRNKERYLR